MSDRPDPTGRGAAVAAVLRRNAAARSPWLDVRGPSMGAAVPAGARVQLVVAERPRRGEIWAFCLPDATVVVHRYRRRIGGRLQFQGDASPWLDELVAPEQLVGRVVRVEHSGRTRRIDGWWVRTRDRARLDLAAARRRLRRRTR